MLDAVRLGRVRPDGRARRVREGAAGLRALEARGCRSVALDVLLLVSEQISQGVAVNPLAVAHVAG